MSVVPVEFLDMPACDSADRLTEFLAGLVSRATALFLVRSSVVSHNGSSEQIHSTLARMIHEASLELPASDRLCPPRRERRISGDLFKGHGQGPIGEFHFDRNRDGKRSWSFLNTALRGGGLVLGACMGPDVEAALSLPHHTEDEGHPHNLLLQGLADSRLTGHQIFMAEVAAGDSVVLLEEGSDATWHRFDTDQSLGLREVAVSTFKQA